MQTDISKLLPVGSVVLLENAHKRLMIVGILQEENNANEKVDWDYIGVLYPEGFLGAEEMLLFNHDKIETVCFEGYTDEEFNTFREELQEYIFEEDE